MDNTPAPWSITWDAIIVGAGCAGLAAAWTLARAGQRCLILSPDGDLAWEAGRAFAPADDVGGGAWWSAWSAWQQQRGTPLGDGAQGEMAAHALLANDADLAWLGYAPLVALEHDAGLIASGIVASKSGLRRLCARRWLDADEYGLVARLCGAAAPPEATAWQQHWLLLHRRWPASVLPQPRLATGASLSWVESAWPDERRLRLESPDLAGLTDQVAVHLHAIRAALAPACGDAAVGAVASRCLPVHAATAPPPALPANLAVAVPGWSPAGSLAERCRSGEAAARSLLNSPPATRWQEGAPVAGAPTRSIATAVMVAGTGTSGATAALAAAEHGAATVACDPSWIPGGIGTGGLIAGYCSGADGGRAMAVDAAAAALPFCADGRGGGGTWWHPQAKATALSDALRQAGVRLLPGSVVYHVVHHEGAVSAVDVATPAGPLRIHCTTLIDATGDGDVCALAGAGWNAGRSGDGGVLAYTQSAYMVHAGEPLRLAGTNCDCGWVDATDSADLSRARCNGMRLLAAKPPGASRPVLLAPHLGIRQSRHIRTDATLTLADLIAHRRVDDAIGPTETFLDTHASDIHAEDDEVVVWLLLCRAFRARIAADLPYRMLLPRGLRNVWIACRAAGVSPVAAYGVRMQRDMQRLGEAAGIAAALAASGDGASRGVDIARLQARLRASGALRPPPTPERADPLAVLDAGEDAAALWQLWHEHPRHAEALHARLGRTDRSGWLAAAILAAAGEAVAEPYLLAAIAARTVGLEPTQSHSGAFGQRIVVPDWVLAVILLRCCGTPACLPVLERLAAGSPPFDLRCIIALTAERLAARLDGGHRNRLQALVDRLAAAPADDAVLPPSRSVWRRLQGEPDPPLPHVHHDGSEDLSWQLRRISGRMAGWPMSRRSPCSQRRRAASGVSPIASA